MPKIWPQPTSEAKLEISQVDAISIGDGGVGDDGGGAV